VAGVLRRLAACPFEGADERRLEIARRHEPTEPFQPTHQQLELPHVARPVVERQGFEHVGVVDVGEARGIDAPEVSQQRHHVVGPLAQGRYAQHHARQAGQQVVTELGCGRRGDQVAVGGRHEAHVDRDGHGGADREHGALLERTQQLGLQRRLELTHLVEEQRAARRAAQEPRRRLGRPRERAAPVPEQGRLGKITRDGGAVHRAERPRAAAPRV